MKLKYLLGSGLFIFIITVMLNVCCYAAQIEYKIDDEYGSGTLYFDTESGTITGHSDDLRGDITIPSEIETYTVTKIGDNAFKDTSQVFDVIISDGIQEIGERAFSNSSIANVSIPGSIVKIGNYAFAECDLHGVEISDGVQEIGERAFTDCGLLESISIPGSVKKIGDFAFSGLELQEVEISDGVQEIGDSAFEFCGSITELTIPGSVVNIGFAAFRDNQMLETLNIVSGVKYIGEEAFSGCFELQSVEIPGTVETICEGAFSDCFSIENLVLNDGIKNIQLDAFAYCDGLTDVEIPASVVSLENNVFRYSNFLTDIRVNAGNNQYKDVDGIVFTKDDTRLVAYPAGKADGKVEEKYTIPGNVKIVGDAAFDGCIFLTEVEIPNGVEEIEKDAFSNMGKISSITIPSSVTKIDSNPFWLDSNLEQIKVDPGNTFYEDKDGVLFNESITELIAYPAKKSGTYYSIPDTVKSISYGAFSNNCLLERIDIPETVNNIEPIAFTFCEALKSICIPENVKEIKYSTFATCDSLREIVLSGSTTVDENAFYGDTALESITLSDKSGEALFGVADVADIFDNAGSYQNEFKGFKYIYGYEGNKAALDKLAAYSQGKGTTSVVRYLDNEGVTATCEGVADDGAYNVKVEVDGNSYGGSDNLYLGNVSILADDKELAPEGNTMYFTESNGKFVFDVQLQNITDYVPSIRAMVTVKENAAAVDAKYYATDIIDVAGGGEKA